MPELPEVQTTVNGLNIVLKNLTIQDVWTDYFVNTKHTRTDNIKNEVFFNKFRSKLIGQTFLHAERRGKNILIHFSGEHTVLIHMKMTGHLLYGTYTQTKNVAGKKVWQSSDKNLVDPFNQFIHFIINFNNGKSLAFSDMRKFAKVTFTKTDILTEHADIHHLGPEANDPALDWKTLKQRLQTRPAQKDTRKIKSVLMDQSRIAGIGNIYSDEILWTAGIHPERTPASLSDTDFKHILTAARTILAHSITVGGDSMSDYRNIYGERGGFQNSHKAYRQTGKFCQKHGCTGTIVRKIIGGRSAHFCSVHQQ